MIRPVVIVIVLLAWCGGAPGQTVFPPAASRADTQPWPDAAADRDTPADPDDERAEPREAVAEERAATTAEVEEHGEPAANGHVSARTPADTQPVGPPPPPSLFAQRQDVAGRTELAGVWSATIGSEPVILELNADGTFALNDRPGTYERFPGRLVLHFPPTDELPAQSAAYQYRLVNKQLELSGNDLEAPVTFLRQFSMAVFLADLFNTNVDDIWQRIRRIGFIIVIVVVANVVIAAIRATAHLLIFSQWGPLALVYRRRKNRARTIYSIVLNLVKYFIYFTALGMILAELGVNYMTYVASLSVIGLAVGFGSQGLVQDMVTGFFIIFESQFDVGDMVEISGQNGYVIELGLRMTKLRNYLGQTVIIPNRNIAMVGNYSRGAQRAYIDMQVPGPEAGEQAMAVMQQLGEELLKQFEGAAMGPLKVSGPWTLATGEHFVRLHLCIWPGQTWLITEQAIPRLREAMKRQGMEITNDRLTVYYHAVAKVEAVRWRQRLRWPRQRDDAPAAAPPGQPGV